MTNASIVVFGMLTLVGVCGLSIIKGAAPERWSAAWILLSWLAVVLGELFVGAENLTLLVLSADGVLATALLFISIQYASLWLGGAMLVQSSAFALHAWFLTDGGQDRTDYILLLNLLSYAVLALLLLATLFRWAERVRRRNPVTPIHFGGSPQALP
jgi:hypothetical protein